MGDFGRAFGSIAQDSQPLRKACASSLRNLSCAFNQKNKWRRETRTEAGMAKDSLCRGHAKRDTSRSCVSRQSRALKPAEFMGHSRKNGTLHDSAPSCNPNVSPSRIDSLALGGRYSLFGKRGYSLFDVANNNRSHANMISHPTKNSKLHNCGQNKYAPKGATSSSASQARA